MGCCKKFIDKHKAALDKAKKAWDFITLLLFIADIATDGYASYNFFLMGDIVWGSLTLCFIFPALIFMSVSFMSVLIDEDSSWPMKIFLVIVSICFAPLITLSGLVYCVVISIKGDSDGAEIAGTIKFAECVLESGPQSCLQLYIIFRYLEDEKIVGAWQYLTLIVSIITLSIGISNFYIFTKSKIIIRVSFFVFGFLSTVGKLLICSIFSLVLKPLWLLPISTFIVLSIIMWLIKKYCNCTGEPLAKDENVCSLANILPLTTAWMVVAVFDSFSISSLPIAIVSLVYAVVGYFLIPGTIAIVAIAFAVLSLLANIALLAVPQFRIIGETWVAVDEENGEGSFY